MNKITLSIPQKTSNYKSWLLTEKDYPLNGSKREQFEALLHWVVTAPSSHNTQPWGFYVDENEKSILIVPEMERLLKHSDVSMRELYISIGAAVKTLEITAKRFGWDPNIKYVSEKKNKDIVYVKVTLKKNFNAKEADISLFNAITKRANFDGNHLKRELPKDFINDINSVFKHKYIDFKLVQAQSTKNFIARLAKQGNITIFNDKRFVDELVRWIRDHATTRKDGILTSAIGLPKQLRKYTAKILLNMSENDINQMAKVDQKKIESSNAIGLLATEQDDIPTWLTVGQLYQEASLIAANKGIYFGARAVLIETEDLHKKLEKKCSLKGRAQMMFRVGYPASDVIFHAPRFSAQEKKVVRRNNIFQVNSTNKPTIFHLTRSLDLEALLKALGRDVQVESASFAEHWLPELFAVLNPSLPFGSKLYLKRLQQFVDSRNNDFEGTWVFYPRERILQHLLDEDDFYNVITASNSRKISPSAQKKMRALRIGACGLSGSGTEAVLAVAMSGAKYLRLSDFDFISPKNLNRMEGAVGENKTWELSWRLWKHNPFLVLDLYPEGITKSNIKSFVKGLDLILEQTDSANKFRIRKFGKQAGSVIVQITDMPDPIVDIELPIDPDFGGRAQKAGITELDLEKIKSIGESTAYLPILMGPEKIPAEAYLNFYDLVRGEANSYSQLFLGAQGGGAALGRIFHSLAEGKLSDLPRSYLVYTQPPHPKAEANSLKAFNSFWEVYKKRYGNRLENFYKQKEDTK